MLDAITETTLTAERPNPSGIGYLIKKIFVSRNIIDFLSKTGWVDSENVMLSRIPERVINSGNITSAQIGKLLTPAMFNYGINCQIQSAMPDHPLIKTYLQWRTENVDYRECPITLMPHDVQ